MYCTTCECELFKIRLLHSSYFILLHFPLTLSLKTIAIYIEVGFILCISLTVSLKVLTFFLCRVIIIVIIFGCAAQHVGLYFPDQGSNQRSLHWKRRVVTAGPPGKSCTGLLLQVGIIIK